MIQLSFTVQLWRTSGEHTQKRILTPEVHKTQMALVLAQATCAESLSKLFNSSQKKQLHTSKTNQLTQALPFHSSCCISNSTSDPIKNISIKIISNQFPKSLLPFKQWTSTFLLSFCFVTRGKDEWNSKRKEEHWQWCLEALGQLKVCYCFP